MRHAVSNLVALGPLPDEDAGEEAINRWWSGLKAIQRPLDPNQALATTRHLMRPSGGTPRQSSTYRRHLRREERD